MQEFFWFTLSFHFDPVPNARAGNYELQIRNRTRDGRGKANSGPVVEDYGVEGHSERGWRAPVTNLSLLLSRGLYIIN